MISAKKWCLAALSLAPVVLSAEIIDDTLDRARKEKKNVMILLTDSLRCSACRRLSQEVLADPAIKTFINDRFLIVTLDSAGTIPPDTATKAIQFLQTGTGGTRPKPTTLVLDADGRLRGVIAGYLPKDFYRKELMFLEDPPSLFRAILRDSVKDVKELLKKGADVNAASPSGRTPLIAAVQSGCDPEIIRLLLAHKADVNRQDMYLSAALHYAAHFDRAEAAGLLLAAGADVRLADSRKQTPLDIAIRRGNRATAEKLRGKGK